MSERISSKAREHVYRVSAATLTAIALGVAPSIALGKGQGAGKDATVSNVGATGSDGAGTPTIAALSKGLIVLSASADNALRLNGNGRAICPVIQVNSTSITAVSSVGNGRLETSMLQVVGDMSGGARSSVVGSINCDACKMTDPYAALKVDAAAMGPDLGSRKIAGGLEILSPGYYSGGIQISGNAQVRFQPGVYYLAGDGLKLSAMSGVGEDVTFVLVGGSVDTSGQTNLNISPTSSGPFAGVAIYQPASNRSAMNLSGGSTINLRGSIYVPGGNLTIVGNGSIEAPGSYYGDLVVADTVNLSGQGVIRMGSTSAVQLPGVPMLAD